MITAVLSVAAFALWRRASQRSESAARLNTALAIVATVFSVGSFVFAGIQIVQESDNSPTGEPDPLPGAESAPTAAPMPSAPPDLTELLVGPDELGGGWGATQA